MGAVARPAGAGADTAKLGIEPMQVFTQDPDHLHAVITVASEELSEARTRHKAYCAVIPSFCRNAMGVSRHAFA